MAVELRAISLGAGVQSWGAHPMAVKRAPSYLRGCKPEIYCMGKTKAGAPKHPLYIKSGTPLEVFR